MKDFQYITNSHPGYIENLYNDFLKDPETVDPDIRKFFEGYDYATSSLAAVKPAVNGNGQSSIVSTSQLDKEFAVYQLIQAYRKKGHLVAKTNPIRERKDRHANLELSYFGLADTDLDNEFDAGKFANLGRVTLKAIIAHLQQCYTNHVGVEYGTMREGKRLDWLQNAMEKDFLKPVSLEQKKRILQKLNEGVMFEKFLQTKYVGQKRFGLEGGETTIAALDAIINTSSFNDVQEVVIGMAHRGRLNILANILGKTYEQIFTEFEGLEYDENSFAGDVKYHLGYSANVATESGKKIHMSVAPNPSNLICDRPQQRGGLRRQVVAFRDDP